MMLGRIILVCVIALVAYVILPFAGQHWLKKRWLHIFSRLKTDTGIAGVCVSCPEGNLVAQTISSKASANETFTIRPKNTAFFMLRKNEEPKKIEWDTVSLLQNGTTVYFLKSKQRFTPNICFFYEEKNIATFLERIQGLSAPATFQDTLKPYWIASGAFLEFVLFLQYIQNPELSMASIAALVGIFAKALPYSPPGLFFTVAANLLPKDGASAKKNRQLKAAGIALITTGILLNIGVIFFVIRHSRF